MADCKSSGDISLSLDMTALLGFYLVFTNFNIMKRLLTLLCATCFLYACNDERDKAETHTTLLEAATEVSTDVADTLCFVRTEGTANHDTTYVRLAIHGDQVQGEMNWQPYEKDGRYGSLHGVKNGDVINANWHYTQEGYSDSMPVIFKMEGDVLLQKEGSVDEKTGREFVAENANFSVKFLKANCR